MHPIPHIPNTMHPKIKKLEGILPKAYFDLAIHCWNNGSRKASGATERTLNLPTRRDGQWAAIRSMFDWGLDYKFWLKVTQWAELPEDKRFPVNLPHIPPSLTNTLASPDAGIANKGKLVNSKHMSLPKYANQTVAVVTLVEGYDVTEFSATEIINQIKARKKATRDLSEAGISGAYLDQEVADHAKAVVILQAELNGRARSLPAAPVAAPADES